MKAVYLDGTIYVVLAWALWIYGQLNDDGSFQSSKPKLIIGSVLIIFTALKTFRSTAYADAKADAAAAKGDPPPHTSPPLPPSPNSGTVPPETDKPK